MAAAGAGDGRCAAVPAVELSSGKPMPRLALDTASFPLGETGRRPAVQEAVLRALDAGYRHLDTAAVYGTECAIGDAVAEAVRAGALASRDELYITSKLWIADAHPGHVLPALRKTLQNLHMEYVDLYLIHFPVSVRLPDQGVEGEVPLVPAKGNLEAMDIRGVWAEMEECQRQGLTKAIGVSNFTCKKLDNLLSLAKIIPDANQVPKVVESYKQRRRQATRHNGGCGKQRVLEALAVTGGLRATAGACGQHRGSQECVSTQQQTQDLDCPFLKQIAHERGKTIAQVCIRWVYEQGDCVIAKSFNEMRMRENLDVFDWQLTEEDCRKINTLPESRGTYDFFVHESGPYKTAEEFWDGEIVTGQSNLKALSLDPIS